MLGIDDAVTAVSTVISKVIDRAIPDPAQAAAAKLEILKEENQQALRLVQSDLSAVLAEAQSADKWTSRARPSFLYVIYAMILLSVPIGIVHAVQPVTAAAIAAGTKAWLTALPEGLWQLFGLGYLGYTGGRTFEKWKGAAK
jgi:Holin of 3TMs, for gene-transfer release